MIFSSLIFVYAFLPIAIAVFFTPRFFGLNSVNISLLILTILSAFFYYIGSGKYLILFIISILINFYVGNLLVKNKLNGSIDKILLIAGISINIVILVYFKYFRFTLDTLAPILGVNILPEINPYLPVGISFYTFMGISYLVECYRNKNSKGTFLEFTTYITFFPHLIAGPIVRFSEISDQIRTFNLLTLENFLNGCFRFSIGFAMKVFLADTMAVVADDIFSAKIENMNSALAWLGAIAYTFQIYFDFAGYSTMAIGLALMFGIKFPENFNYPYLANSITNFWRRWHISLSSWLRDYLYIPLGGSRRTKSRTYINLFVVFLVCGLWHGAAWTFVIWGLYHGCILILERAKVLFFNSDNKGIPSIALTFLMVMVGWVIFRSESVDFLLGYLHHLFFINNKLDINEFISIIFSFSNNLFYFILLVCILFSFGTFKYFPVNLITSNKYLIVGQSLIFIILFLSSTVFALNSSYKPFIYFRF